MKSIRLPILALLLCALLSVGCTIAYLSDTTSETCNEFTPGKADIDITESFNGAIKTNVRVGVSSNSPSVYIRVKAVPGWYYEDGTMAAVPVEDTYTATLGSGWIPHGDYYYYTQKVSGGGSTGDLFSSVQPKSASALDPMYDNLRFHFDILADAIQAEGTDDVSGKPIVEEAWGINPSQM